VISKLVNDPESRIITMPDGGKGSIRREERRREERERERTLRRLRGEEGDYRLEITTFGACRREMGSRTTNNNSKSSCFNGEARA
jgi:hypothetical protein